MGKMESGTFDVINGAIATIRRSDRKLLLELSQILQRAQRGDISQQDAGAELAAKAPELGGAIDYLRRNHLAWIAILISLIAIIVAHNDATSNDELMRLLLEQSQLHEPTAERPNNAPQAESATQPLVRNKVVSLEDALANIKPKRTKRSERRVRGYSRRSRS
jgi:hypothetical protein